MAKDLLFKSLKCQCTDRAAWVPFAGVHSGKIRGYSATEVLQDADKLLHSLAEVKRLYQPDGMPVVFDLQIEAEILGCELQWADRHPPSVVSHPLSHDESIPCDCALPKPEDGRLPLILEVMRKMKEKVGQDTALYGLVCGPFTLASHLRGTAIFLDMYDRPQYVKELLNFCAKTAELIGQYYQQAGMDVIAYVDPMVSQISNEHFRTFLEPLYTELFLSLKKRNCYSSFFVCGDASRNIEAMCRCQPDNISIDENIDIVKAKETCNKYQISVGGNIQLTVTMLHGSQAANMKAVVDIIDSCGIKGLIVSPGCDLPYETPIENVIAASQAVLHTEESRAMLAGFADDFDLSAVEVTMVDYSALDLPLVEIFTIDSLACAACTYMVAAVKDLFEKQPDTFNYIERKFTEKENIARCKLMGVSSLPALYINGRLYWSSLVPSSLELAKAITENRK